MAMGWGPILNGYLGRPIAFAMASPVWVKAEVQITAAGMPCRSKVMPSDTLPDEQPPQSPTPVTTMSHLAAISPAI